MDPEMCLMEQWRVRLPPWNNQVSFTFWFMAPKLGWLAGLGLFFCFIYKRKSPAWCIMHPKGMSLGNKVNAFLSKEPLSIYQNGVKTVNRAASLHPLIGVLIIEWLCWG